MTRFAPAFWGLSTLAMLACLLLAGCTASDSKPDDKYGGFYGGMTGGVGR
jgi:hypothetical protein